MVYDGKILLKWIGSPKWMVYFMGNAMYKWMMIGGGTPILGNLQLEDHEIPKICSMLHGVCFETQDEVRLGPKNNVSFVK